MAPSLPVTLRVDGWRCLVVGGGAVAARRVETLLKAGAQVAVAATESCESIRSLAHSGTIVHFSGPYESSQLDGIRLVVAATDNAKVNATVAADAKARGILLNDADEPSRGDVMFPSVVRRGDLILSVTTAGASPSLARRVRDELALRYGPEWETYVALLGQVRDRVLAEIPDPTRRKDILHRVAEDENLLPLIREGRADEARARAFACISPSSD